MSIQNMRQNCDVIVQCLDQRQEKSKKIKYSYVHFGTLGVDGSVYYNRLKKYGRECDEAVKAAIAILKQNIDSYSNSIQLYMNQKEKELAEAKQNLNCVNTWNKQTIKELEQKCNQYRKDN